MNEDELTLTNKKRAQHGRMGSLIPPSSLSKGLLPGMGCASCGDSARVMPGYPVT
jgi:hypothetical protein